MICRKTLAIINYGNKSIIHCIPRKIGVLSLTLDGTNLTEMGSICENCTISEIYLKNKKIQLFES